ncbi:hypothetical protein H3Z85_10630 [Chryseobacterium indologenes]|uniref:hypothetical protein n=1 Tax=Chryseobacterium TaxID=59732 RepID=UPI0003E06A73|nr:MULTISPECIES: hypothetical protein [Chryseobacterium]MBF6646113.1 hypothetical protein [Chryseobacterium indologenes]MBU3047756.1 hypothetical protein [Chryseobacterium indologenes]MEB4762619.1 hypothetical protein [Chryseobacterium indologenes]QIX80354.1 hypothetical protein FOB56_03530 [Chryseobacterium indologenes]QPQ53724.1 hypothetical protein H3Z85_10630 [Chryseobacterium indologenes]
MKGFSDLLNAYAKAYNQYSSYLNVNKPSKICRSEIMRYFDTLDIFVAYHQSHMEYDFLDVD